MTWNEVTVQQFIEIKGVEKDPLASIDRDLHIFSILLDKDIEELEEMDYGMLKQMGKDYAFLQTEPSKKVISKVGEYTYKGFKDLTLGEYIDLCFFMGSISEYLPNALGLVYRLENEPYNYDVKKRSELFLNLSINLFYGVITDFISFKDSFEETYKELFVQEVEGDEPEELDEEDKKQIKEEQLALSWGWERLVYSLCQGDLTRYEKVLELPLYFVFNMLSMKKDLRIE